MAAILGGIVRGAVAEDREFRLQHALVDALCRMSLMNSPVDRQLFVQALVDTVHDLPDIQENPRKRLHIAEIVRACLQHPRGRDGLVMALKLLAPDQGGTAEVISLVQSVSVLELLPRAERERVRALLRQAGHLDVATLWYAAADEMAPLPTEPVSTLEAAFDHLTTLNARADGLPPALALVEYAAAGAAASLSTELCRWNDLQAVRLDVTDELSALRRRAAAEPPAVPALPCLVLQLQEHGIDAGRYVLSNWTQHRPGPWHPQRGEDQLVTLESAERAVEELIRRAEGIWGGRAGPVAIEFILPAKLINEAIDWWCANADSVESVPLCLDYPIVIRSLERMRDHSFHRFWRNRWRTMLSAPFLNAKWVLDGEIDIGLWNAQLRSDETISAVVLGAPPATWSSSGQMQLRMALRAGVPVVLWDRRGQPDHDFEKSVELLLAGPSMSLAERVREFRSQAAIEDKDRRDSHLGRHLAVLWDDPDRLVDIEPYIPFNANEQAEKESGDE